MLKQKTRALYIIIAFLITIIIAGNFRENVVEASQSVNKTVTVITWDSKQTILTNASSVRELLAELNISSDDNYIISHSENEKVLSGMKIYIKKVETKEFSAVEPLPFEKIYVASDRKENTILEPGHNGEKYVTYNVKYINGKEVDKKEIESVIIRESIPEKISCGKKNNFIHNKKSKSSYSKPQKTSRAMSFAYKNVKFMNSTAYSASNSKTSTGTRAVRGVVAVDPKVIPLGTKLYIEGYGYAIAGDTGKSIKGNKIDVCMSTKKECKKWGNKKVKVYILN